MQGISSCSSHDRIASAGQYGGTHLDHESGGKRLGEHERHEIVVRKNDTVLLGPEDDMLFEVLWVEDSLGTQYLVPGSREFIKKLRQ